MRNTFTHRRQGVTLIELLIVIAIIAILSAFATPNFITTLRNYRLRASAMQLLTAVRETRTQAMSNARQFTFTVSLDNATQTFMYSRERLAFKQINLMKLPIVEYLYEDTSAELVAINTHPENKDVAFNHRAGILSMETVPSSGFEVTFNPSGTADIPTTAIAKMKMYGHLFGYEVRVYKGGQISLHQIDLP